MYQNTLIHTSKDDKKDIVTKDPSQFLLGSFSFQILNHRIIFFRFFVVQHENKKAFSG